MNEEEEMKLFEEYDRDADWFQENFDKLADKYAGMALAIKKGDIIASSDNIDDLIIKIEKKGENPAMIFVGTILPNDEILIL